MRYEGGGRARIAESEVEGDLQREPDQRTAEFVQSIAQIFGCIQFTADYPSKNEDGRMPYILASVQRESMAIYVTYDKV